MSDDVGGFLTPEQHEEMARQRRAELEAQLARAQALRSNNASKFSTPVGAGLAGIGDIINSISSMSLGGDAQAAMQKAQADYLRGAGSANAEAEKRKAAALQAQQQREAAKLADERTYQGTVRQEGYAQQRERDERQAAEAQKGRSLQMTLKKMEEAAALERARVMAGAQKEKQANGKILPASEAAQIGGIDAAVQMLDGLMQTRKEKAHGPKVLGIPVLPAGVAQHIGGTDAAQYTDAQKAAAQTVGKILEGGKLAEGDLKRYMDLIPTAGDGDERAAAKVENVKRLLGAQKEAQLKAFGGAGYDIGTLTPGIPGAASSPSPAQAAPKTERRQLPDGRIVERGADGKLKVVSP